MDNATPILNEVTANTVDAASRALKNEMTERVTGDTSNEDEVDTDLMSNEDGE